MSPLQNNWSTTAMGYFLWHSDALMIKDSFPIQSFKYSSINIWIMNCILKSNITCALFRIISILFFWKGVWLPYRRGLYVLPELIHGSVGDAHVSEHPFQFRGKLTATFCLRRRKKEWKLGLILGEGRTRWAERKKSRGRVQGICIYICIQNFLTILPWA